MSKPKPKKTKSLNELTEKELKGKLKYRKAKRRKQEKRLNSFFEQIGVKDFTKFPKKKKFKFEDEEGTAKTIADLLINDIYHTNNKIDEINSSLERFYYEPAFEKFTEKKNPEQKETAYYIGFVWEVDRNYPIVIFENTRVKSIDGMDKARDADKIIDLINDKRNEMSSKDVMYMLLAKGNGRIVVQNSEYDDLGYN